MKTIFGLQERTKRRRRGGEKTEDIGETRSPNEEGRRETTRGRVESRVNKVPT